MYIGSTGSRGLHHLVIPFPFLSFFQLSWSSMAPFNLSTTRCSLRFMRYLTTQLTRHKLVLLQRLTLFYMQMVQSAFLMMDVGYVICYTYSFSRIFFFIQFSFINILFLQIPTDLHPATRKSSLETVLTVLLLHFFYYLCLI